MIRGRPPLGGSALGPLFRGLALTANQTQPGRDNINNSPQWVPILSPKAIQGETDGIQELWVVTWLPAESRAPVRLAPLPPKPAEMTFDNQKDAVRLAMNLRRTNVWSYTCPAAKSSGDERLNRCSRLKCWPPTNRIGAESCAFQKKARPGRETGRAGEVVERPDAVCSPSGRSRLPHPACNGLTVQPVLVRSGAGASSLPQEQSSNDRRGQLGFRCGLSMRRAIGTRLIPGGPLSLAMTCA
jgi:hypothetical protein